MKEFKCGQLGYACPWKQSATEDLLADMVALHLRDVHGVAFLAPDRLALVKQLFAEPGPDEAAEAEHAALQEYVCDLGSGCGWRYIAMTKDLIVDGAAVHAREAHGIREFSPEMMARVRRSVHAWSAEGKTAA